MRFSNSVYENKGSCSCLRGVYHKDKFTLGSVNMKEALTVASIGLEIVLIIQRHYLFLFDIIFDYMPPFLFLLLWF